MNLHYDVSGSGEIPLVCIHGWACDGAQFSELSRLLENDFRIYRPDLPGHGKTPLNGFTPSFENYADVIIDFCQQQGLHRPVLLGHSMGGVLALMIAAKESLEPRYVISLDGSLPMAEGTIAGQKMIRSWLGSPDFLERFADLLHKAFFVPKERDDRCLAIIRTMCSAPEVVLHFLPEQIETVNADRILPTINVPVLFIGSVAPRFDPQKAAALARDFHIEQIFDHGHFLHIYAPQKVAKIIKDFRSNYKFTIAGSP